MRAKIVVLRLVVVMASGCGPGSPALDDAGSDAGTQTDGPADTGPACEYSFGRTYILNHLSILGPGEATVDINGDGVPDNAMSVLAGVVNVGWETSIPEGSTLYLFDVTGWSDPPTASDPDVGLVFYKGIDADSPPEPSDNLSGAGEFVVLSEQFDLECQPTSGFDHVTLVDRVLTADTARWTWIAPGVGTVEFVDIKTVWHFNEDYSVLESDSQSGVWTICGLSRALFPGPTPGTFLDLLVKSFGLQADIDRDGDGLEQVIYENEVIVKCLDGDGTEIPGKDCVCDPRIKDGYSVAMKSIGVPARITGVVEANQ